MLSACDTRATLSLPLLLRIPGLMHGPEGRQFALLPDT